MGKVVGLDGKERTDATHTPLAILKELVRAIEEDGQVIDKLFVIAEVTDPANPDIVYRPTWDSNLTIEQSVFLIEVAKADIFKAMYVGRV